MILTIFTPTYNRVHTLEKLYTSLIQQNNFDFEWLIVDDGSTDDTKDIVEKWKQEKLIRIRYYYQSNSGKMKAHNQGVLLADGELFFCVDSDDYLYDDLVVQRIIEKWSMVSDVDKQSLSGILAQKYIINGNQTSSNKFPTLLKVKLSDLYNKFNYHGDTALIFQTKVLREYLFPEISGEKFITEAYVYELLDQKYDYLLFPFNLVTCEYMPDGYTFNTVKTFVENPKGWILYYKQHAKNTYSQKEYLKTIYRYISVSLINNDSFCTIINESPNKLLALLFFPLGYIKYIKDFKLYNSIKK